MLGRPQASSTLNRSTIRAIERVGGTQLKYDGAFSWQIHLRIARHEKPDRSLNCVPPGMQGEVKRLSTRQLISLGFVLGVALAIYVGIEGAFSGEAVALRGYFLLTTSTVASLIIAWLLTLHRTLPWVTAVGRTTAVTIWVITLAGYHALGMGSFGDLRWAILFLVPAFAVVAEWDKHQQRIHDLSIVANSRLFPLSVALTLVTLLCWTWRGVSTDTKVFLLAGSLLCLLGTGTWTSKQKKEESKATYAG